MDVWMVLSSGSWSGSNTKQSLFVFVTEPILNMLRWSTLESIYSLRIETAETTLTTFLNIP